MDPADQETLLARIEVHGYDLERLHRTAHPVALSKRRETGEHWT